MMNDTDTAQNCKYLDTSKEYVAQNVLWHGYSGAASSYSMGVVVVKMYPLSEVDMGGVNSWVGLGLTFSLSVGWVGFNFQN